MNSLTAETHSSITHIGREAWDSLVASGSPFLEYDFLLALEESGSLDPGSGWGTAILAVRRGDALLGALPFYVKSHSRGEFVYDWAWAEAASRAQIPYYPKAVVAVPFTPVTGARLLIAPDTEGADEVRRALVAAALEVAGALGLTGVHFNFITREEVSVFEDAGLPIRTQLQYHWQNAGYADFDDYLARFRSKRRANIRRERRKLAGAGVTTRVVTGEELDEALMRRVFRYYRDTVNRYFWGQRYLNEEFFVRVGANLRDRVHVVVAELDGREFAGTFNLVKGNRLYGRYWGSLEDVEFAHFEVCFYTPIEWAIAHEIEVFEPGHGGEHKFERGFEPVTTYSAHWLADPRLDNAVREALVHERAEVERRRLHLMSESPYAR